MLAEVGKDNALEICRDYLLGIGIEESLLEQILNAELFEGGFVQNLQKSCIVPKNKPNKNDKTTHIAITGNSRLLFYNEVELKIAGGRDDEQIKVELLNANLAHLLFLNTERVNTPFKFNDKVEIISSSTVKKISGRGNQVQLSKFKYDEDRFLDFRRGLYIDDLLIILKYANKEETYLAVGIPSLQIRELVKPNFSRELSSTDAQTIGAYSINQDRDREVSSKVDLSQATEKRLKRSVRHQTLLRNIASRLQNAGYRLYEGMIDCLATKKGEDVLIFEMKTLDGTPPDEMNQVRDALGQLLYYDFLQSGQFKNDTKIKIACFESEISEDHRVLLMRNGCQVVWMNKDDILDGTKESLEFLNRLLR